MKQSLVSELECAEYEPGVGVSGVFGVGVGVSGMTGVETSHSFRLGQ